MLTLAALTARLQADVPPQGGTPTTAQYERAVRDALADVSRRAPMRKVATIAVTAGVATYPLPADFVRAIQLPGGPCAGGVVIGADGMLYPAGAGEAETWAVAGTTVTVRPAPRYAMPRDLVYAAGYVADEAGAYPDLSEDLASIALLKAQARVWELIAAAAPSAAGGAVKKYTQGQLTIERVSAEQLATSHRATAARLLGEYAAALETHIGAVGM
jgi:hypothetical protein